MYGFFKSIFVNYSYIIKEEKKNTKIGDIKPNSMNVSMIELLKNCYKITI